MGWNDWLFRVINGSSNSVAPVMHFFSEATQHLWVRVVLIGIVVAMIARGARSRAAAIQALLAVAVANGITDLFKHLLPEPRPYQDLHDVVLHVANLAKSDMASAIGTSARDAANWGTASAHSANMAAVAFVFCYRLRAWGIPWILIALVTGYSRIYLAAHYPYQVLLGWCCGCVAGLIICKTWDLLVRTKPWQRRNLQVESSDAT